MFHNRHMDSAREAMVERLCGKGIYSGALRRSLLEIPRHLFVSEALRYRAYEDVSLPIGSGQTISRPGVIALMVQALELKGNERVLEIGTGSGYQSALLSRMASTVVTMERIEDLYRRAMVNLVKCGVSNVQCLHSGNFYEAEGDFDAVIISAGTERVPGEIGNIISDGGVLVVPVMDGGGHSIMRFMRRDTKLQGERIGSAFFVPYIEGATA